MKKHRRKQTEPKWDELVLYARRRRGMTQQQFAEHLGVSFATVNRWETGRTQPSRLARNLLSGFLMERMVNNS